MVFVNVTHHYVTSRHNMPGHGIGRHVQIIVEFHFVLRDLYFHGLSQQTHMHTHVLGRNT